MIDENKIQEAVDKSYRESGHNAYFSNGFYAGMEFAIKELESEKKELLEMLKELVNLHNLGHDIGQYNKAIELIKRATE